MPHSTAPFYSLLVKIDPVEYPKVVPDVAEEIDRLGSHVTEVSDILRRSEPVGRRLDFLIQELNREANTFASKVQEEPLTRVGVELKVLIEQMREQVQNLE